MELSSHYGDQPQGIENTHLINSSLGNEYENTRNEILKRQDVKKIVIELRKIFDRASSDFIVAKELVLELARKLDESGTCPTNQICRLLKQLLKDKITEGRISSRWIEESLPNKYKREYKKSELSSLSNETENVQVDNGNGAVLIQQPSEDKTHSTVDAQQNNDYNESDGKHPINPIHEEEKIIKLTDSELDTDTETAPPKFVINKVQRELIDKALEYCNEFCYLKFDTSGILVEVTTDSSVEVP